MSHFLVIPLIPCPFFLWPYIQHPPASPNQAQLTDRCGFHLPRAQSPHHNSLASQHSFAVLHPDPALVLLVSQSDSSRTSERWSFTTQSLQQIRSLICMESLASLSSYPRPAAGLARDRILWDSSSNSSKSAPSMQELSSKPQKLGQIWVDKRSQPSRQIHPFLGSYSAEQAVPRNLRKGNENSWSHTFQVSISARKLLSYLGWN